MLNAKPLVTLRGVILVTVLLWPSIATSQNWNLIYSRELEAEELMMDHQFQEAAEKYIHARELIPQSYNLAFKIGYCYLLADNQLDLAYQFMKEAASNASKDHEPRSLQEMNAPPVAHFFLGRIYQIRREFDRAILSFNRFLEMVGPDNEFRAMAEQQIASSRLAPTLMKDAQHVVLHNLGSSINTLQPNFNAVVSGNGKVMAYTTLARVGFDVFIAQLGANGWGNPRRITNDLGGKYLKTAALSHDGTELLLIEDAGRGLDILVSVRQEMGWSEVQRLRRPINSKHNEAHASLSADGNTIYFTSDRPGGLGGLDIYSSTLDDRGRWSEPLNLGPGINTPLNEHTSFVTHDNVIFFSSEGHKGLGGYDIFYADLNADLTPQNLGYPINTPDDNQFFFPESKRSGFLAQVHPNNVGARDIHYVRIVPTINLMANISGGGAEAVQVAVYQQDQPTPIAQAEAKSMGQTLIHRLPPGRYRISISSPNFEPFQTQFQIPDDFSGSDFAVQAQLMPVAQVAQLDVTPPPPAQPVAQPATTAQAPMPQPQREAIPTQGHLGQTDRELPAATTPQQPRARMATTPPIATDMGEGVGRYTVQIMALNSPVSPTHFHEVDNLIVVSGTDGFYRYSSGVFASSAQAQVTLQRMIGLGYHDAFIRPIPLGGVFSVQVMALRLPRSPKAFENLADLIIMQGNDSIFRYSTGAYRTLEQAKEQLPRVVGQGYRDAFVQRIIR